MSGTRDFSDLASSFVAGRISRRDFLEGSALLGMGGLAALVVAACSGQTPSAASSSTGGSSAQATAVASPTAPGSVGSAAASAPTAAASGSVAASSGATPAPKTGGTITIAAAQGIQQMDPYKILFTWEEVLFFILWDALTGYVPGSTDIQPVLAESWKSSDDLKTWTFTLRQGVKFSNGKALTASDVVKDITRAVDPKTGYLYSFLVPPFDSVTAPDASTVQIVLKDPNAFLPEALFKLQIMDPDSLDQINKNPIGTGPFVVTDFVAQDHISFKRNESYWKGPAPLDTIKLEAAQDPTAAVTAVRGGQIDVLWSVPWQDGKQMAASGDAALVVADVPSASVVMEVDNTTPPFNDVRARQALVYATNKQAMIDAAYAGKVLISPSNVPTPSSHASYNPKLPTYDFDLDKAKSLFTAAGVAQGTKFTFWTTSGQYPEWTTWGQILQSDLAKIGITVDIQAVEINAWVDKFAPAGKMWPGVLVPNFYSGFPTDLMLGFWNPGICECNYDSKSFTQLVAEAYATKDPVQRNMLLGQAQMEFANDVPLVILGQTSWPIAVRPNVTGVWEDPGATIHVDQAGLKS